MANKKKIDTRFAWADILRITAIFLVVAVHTTSSLPETMNIVALWPYLLSFAVIKTSVPLFVMLSGALLLGKQESYSIFFRKRILKVLLPWVFWTFVYMAWNYYVHGYHPASLSQWKYFFELTFLSQLWFLPLIFSLYLITPLLRRGILHLTKIDKIYLTTLWFVFVCIFPYFHTGTSFPQSQQSGLIPVTIYYSGYFMVGYFLVNASLPTKMVRRSIGITIIGVAITFLEILFARGVASSVLSSKFFDYFAPGIAIASIGLFLLFLTKFKNTHFSSNKKKLLTVISSASLGIYIIHGLVGEIINKPLSLALKNVHLYPLFQGYIIAFIIFSCSLALVLLLKKMPVVKRLVP